MFNPFSKFDWLVAISYILGSVILNEICNLISPQFYDIYGPDAEIGNYIFMPILWIFHGSLVYFIGVKLNIKKEVVQSGIIDVRKTYKKIKINKYRFLFFPIQYLGALTFFIGLLFLLIQFIYRFNYL